MIKPHSPNKQGFQKSDCTQETITVLNLNPNLVSPLINNNKLSTKQNSLNSNNNNLKEASLLKELRLNLEQQNPSLNININNNNNNNSNRNSSRLQLNQQQHVNAPSFNVN